MIPKSVVSISARRCFRLIRRRLGRRGWVRQGWLCGFFEQAAQGPCAEMWVSLRGRQREAAQDQLVSWPSSIVGILLIRERERDVVGALMEQPGRDFD